MNKTFLSVRSYFYCDFTFCNQYYTEYNPHCARTKIIDHFIQIRTHSSNEWNHLSSALCGQLWQLVSNAVEAINLIEAHIYPELHPTLDVVIPRYLISRSACDDLFRRQSSRNSHHTCGMKLALNQIGHDWIRMGSCVWWIGLEWIGRYLRPDGGSFRRCRGHRWAFAVEWGNDRIDWRSSTRKTGARGTVDPAASIRGKYSIQQMSVQ